MTAHPLVYLEYPRGYGRKRIQPYNDRKRGEYPNPEYLFATAAKMVNMTVDQLKVNRSRLQRLVTLRHMIMYLMITEYGYHHKGAAKAFNQHHTSGTYALHHIGDLLKISDPKTVLLYEQLSIRSEE